ncbi:uncharacterized protein [Anabrus simplex]|uniref:uncharacterized protein isoform X2 n=1 Tax=Anabrus simplex TaxID=316456 RepID=UPI0035A36781
MLWITWVLVIVSIQAVLCNDKYIQLSAQEKDALLRAWKSFDNDTKAGEGVFLAYLEDDPDKDTIMSFISNATNIPKEELVSKGIIELIGKQTLGPYRELMGALDDDEQLSKISNELRDLYIKDGSRPEDLDRKNMVVMKMMKDRLGSYLNPEVEENLSKLFQTVRNRIFLEDE